MTKRWWILVSAFVAGMILLAVGFIQGNVELTICGVIIGTVLYLGRRYFE